MISSISTYVLNSLVQGMLEKDIELSRRITLYDPTHMMNTHHIAIGVYNPQIDGGCSFEIEFTKMISTNP